MFETHKGRFHKLLERFHATYYYIQEMKEYPRSETFNADYLPWFIISTLFLQVSNESYVSSVQVVPNEISEVTTEDVEEDWLK